MNSMLRQHHLRLAELKAYLRIFERNKPISPAEWSAQESLLFEAGHLLFCLEPVAAPAGLSSFSKRGEDQGESYRVKDLCVVISKDDGKCTVINITASAYEMRVLDSLMLEKASKAILDGRDFNYLAARPIQRLDGAQEKALYQVGAKYAQGGSRRSLTVDGSPLEEPTQALLAQLGARLVPPQNKQVIEIGSICHMIFTPESRQEDKNKSLLKATFTPIKTEELALGRPLLETESRAAQPEPTIEHAPSALGQQPMSFTQAPEPAPEPKPMAFTQIQEPLAPTEYKSDTAVPAPKPSPFALPNGPMSFAQPQSSDQQDIMAFNQPPESSVQPWDLDHVPGSGGTGVAFDRVPVPEDAIQAASFDLVNSNNDLPAFETIAMPSQFDQLSSIQANQQALPDLPNLFMAPTQAPAQAPVSAQAPDPASQSTQQEQARAAADWFVLSHEAHPVSVEQNNFQTAEPEQKKEDFSAQFFQDLAQGHAGEAAQTYAESEFAREKEIKDQFEAGKEQRLRQYFGDEHFESFVQDQPIASNHSASYEPVQPAPLPQEPDFDSDIFADAGRSSIEINPEAKPPEPQATVDPLPLSPEPQLDGAAFAQAWAEAAQETAQSDSIDSSTQDTTFAPSDEWMKAVQESFSQTEHDQSQQEAQPEESLFEKLTNNLAKNAASETVVPQLPQTEQQTEQQIEQQTEQPIEHQTNQQADTAPPKTRPRVRPRDYNTPPLRANKPLGESFAQRALSQASHTRLEAQQPLADQAVTPDTVAAQASLPSVQDDSPAKAFQEPAPELVAPQPASEFVAPAPEPVEQMPMPPVTPAAIHPVTVEEQVVANLDSSNLDLGTKASKPAAKAIPQPGEFDSGVRKSPIMSQPDGKLMMNEMASLMAKLEQQVGKAANKLGSRADELRARLTSEVETLVEKAKQIENEAEATLNQLSLERKQRLEALAQEVESTNRDEAKACLDHIERLSQEHIDRITTEERHLSAHIIKSGDEFKHQLADSARAATARLEELIQNRNEELARLKSTILEQLKENHQSYLQKVDQRYDRFKERMTDETASINTSLNRNMRSMMEEIENSLDRACEKLRSTKNDLEQVIGHTVAVSEMAIAQKTKHLLAEQLLPRLNEQKEIIRTKVHDMARQLKEEAQSGLTQECERLDHSKQTATIGLKQAVEASLQELEAASSGLKIGLQETFKKASQDLGHSIDAVNKLVKETELKINASERGLKNLAEVSSVETEPEINQERNAALNVLGSLKQKANRELSAKIEDRIAAMEKSSEDCFANLTNQRMERTATIRDTSESNLEKIRQALADASQAIQQAREKYME